MKPTRDGKFEEHCVSSINKEHDDVVWLMDFIKGPWQPLLDMLRSARSAEEKKEIQREIAALKKRLKYAELAWRNLVMARKAMYELVDL
jgi:hypothetical protein